MFFCNTNSPMGKTALLFCKKTCTFPASPAVNPLTTYLKAFNILAWLGVYWTFAQTNAARIT
jgi:hypothetical protein